MDISFDSAKRGGALTERGPASADAGLVFADVPATIKYKRRDYGEDRYITVGRTGPDALSWCRRHAATLDASFR